MEHFGSHSVEMPTNSSLSGPEPLSYGVADITDMKQLLRGQHQIESVLSVSFLNRRADEA
jgi:hypothetical protein